MLIKKNAINNRIPTTSDGDSEIMVYIVLCGYYDSLT